MKSVCVIFNPLAGRQRAASRLHAFRRRWSHCADFWPTQTPGHAVTLAADAAARGYRIIAAAGGDGTVHEVANGLLASGQDAATFAVVPIGSANDYAFSLRHQFGESQLDDETGHRVDVGHLRTAAGREVCFVESLGIGLSGDITAESRRIANRQGLWLYGTAAYRVLKRRQPPLPLDIIWDDESVVQTPTRLLSVLIGQREGAFLMAPQALLDDGRFDVVHAGDVSHWQAMRLLPRFLLRGAPTRHPLITHRRCKSLQVTSTQPLSIHTDGELFSTTADPVYEVELAILPSRLQVKVCGL